MSVLTPDSPTLSTSHPDELWPTYGPLVANFIENTLVHGEGDLFGEPFRLRDDQLLVLYRWYEYETDVNGEFKRWRYDELFLEKAKGWGKTEFGAAIALAELCGPTAPSTPNIPVAAASFEQADLLFGRAKQIVTHKNCALKPYVDAFDTELLLKSPAQGRMFRIAAVSGTNDGGLPTLFMADETHEWVGGKERLHLVVSNSLRKRKNGRTINMSTPGHNKETLAGRMHDLGVSGEDPRLLHLWTHADPKLDLDDPIQLRKAIEQANPWRDEDGNDSLVRHYAKIPRHEFERYHLAAWVDVPETGWLSDKPGAWEACYGDATFRSGRTVMSIDMSLNRDSTAVGEAQTRIDGRVPVKATIFNPADSGGRIDHLEIKDFIRKRFRELTEANCKPAAIAYDPRYLEVLARELADEGLPMLEMPQSPERMAPACALTYDLIVSQRLVHDGDVVLESHIKAAAKRQTDRGFTLSKGKSKSAIDGCMAVVMAAHEAVTGNDDGGVNLW